MKKGKLSDEVQASGMTMRTWYRDVYLLSDHWKSLRAAALAAHGAKCHKCSSKGPLDVHHLNYRQIYDVQVSDLQVLCRPCHSKEHNKPVLALAFTLPRSEEKAIAKLILRAPRGSRSSMRNWAIGERMKVVQDNALKQLLAACKTGSKAKKLRRKLRASTSHHAIPPPK